MSPMVNFDRRILPGYSNHKSYAGVSCKYTANLLIACPHKLFDSYLSYVYQDLSFAGAIFANVILMTTVCGWLAVCGLTRRGHDLGNSVRDETWHISSIPLGCSPINLIKCNGQPIRRKWPSNFGHSLYISK
ncbi:hypothetical protein AVEN_198503-1 [Araneus ventricosus]|uniref:Uncharacterized protein n=1 Tax=Araneus ventricosus TaxID=182803 RepID=A0A4Y2X7N4_ARAVE|nr:hypothetical protein AVEN_198503-1 [Araneus ventricosus]